MVAVVVVVVVVLRLYRCEHCCMTSITYEVQSLTAEAWVQKYYFKGIFIIYFEFSIIKLMEFC